MTEPIKEKNTETFFNVDWDAELNEEISEREAELLRKIAKKVVEVQMTVPALMFLETMRPFNYLGSQMLLFFEPFTAFILGFKDFIDFRRALSKRASIGMMIDFIEEEDGILLEKQKANRKPFWSGVKESIRRIKNKYRR